MQDLRRIIWLASYPKSGNTWLRVFLGNYFAPKGKTLEINALSEFTTADVRQDFFDRAAGRPFMSQDFDEWVAVRQRALDLIAGSKRNTHFVKTHSQVMRIGSFDLIPPRVTAAAICVMRNPFDVAPSFARHLDVELDDAIRMMQDPKYLTSTETRIFEVLGRWDQHVASWVDAPGLVKHVMRYEDMHANAERSFRQLLAFLQIRVNDGQLRRAIRASSFTSLKKQEQAQGFREKPKDMKQFFAKGETGAWRDQLTPEQVGQIREAFLPALERWYPELVAETKDFARAS